MCGELIPVPQLRSTTYTAISARHRGPNVEVEIEKAAISGGLLVNAGNHLRSHTLTRAVPSAQRGLTSVFGMGTGGTLAVWSPET